MAKGKTVFYCQSCGYESAKWMGQCPGCREWNTFVEEPVIASGSSHRRLTAARREEPTLLSKVSRENNCRISTEIQEFDRVLGGGIVHHKVLENCGIDPNEYSGLAFGIGIERIAMLKYGINNINLLYENDLRFLKQFKG